MRKTLEVVNEFVYSGVVIDKNGKEAENCARKKSWWHVKCIRKKGLII